MTQYTELALVILGAISSTTSVMLFLPQFASIWRLRNHRRALLGVPISRMVILWVQALLWISYGIALGEVWVSVPGVINTPFMVASIVLVHRAHRRHRQQQTGEPT